VISKFVGTSYIVFPDLANVLLWDKNTINIKLVLDVTTGTKNNPKTIR